MQEGQTCEEVYVKQALVEQGHIESKRTAVLVAQSYTS